MDWRNWHGLYNSSWALKMRLALVQNQIKRAISRAPEGPIRVISICAGDGRDLAGAMRRHRRAKDITAVLIEIDANLVAAGRARFEKLGVADRIEYRAMDATDPASYDAAGPADIIIACGMLGLVSGESTPRLVEALKALLKPGGSLIWTRSLALRSGPEHLKTFRGLLAGNAFEEMRLLITMRPLFRSGPESRVRFVVGTHRFQGVTSALPQGPLFEIVDL